MTGPFMVIGAPGAPGQSVLRFVDLGQEKGQENATTRPQVMEERSVRELILRLKYATVQASKFIFL